MNSLRRVPFVALSLLALASCLQTNFCWAEEPASDLLQPGVTLSMKGPEELAFERAKQLQTAQKWDEAREIYRTLAETSRDRWWPERATWQLIQIAESYGDDEELLKALKLALKFPQGNGLIFSVRDAAVRKLGWHYLKQNKFAEAQEFIKDSSTASFCGTCGEMMAQEKYSVGLYCRIHLGEQREAAEELLKRLEHQQPNAVLGDSAYSAFMARLLFEMYRSAEQLPDLQLRLSKVANLPSSVRDELEVQRLFEAQDRAALLKICTPEDTKYILLSQLHHFGKQRAAVEAYLRLTNNDIAPFLQQFSRERVNHTWSIYALGKSGQPAALDRLLELLIDRDHRLDRFELVYAVQLHGPKAIARWQKDPRSQVWKLDEEAQQAVLLERPLPKIPAGSLPK